MHSIRGFVAERIRETQDRKDLKDPEVAAAIGVARSTYIGWKHGHHSPSYDDLMALADLFDVSVAYLLGETDEPRRPEKIIEQQTMPVVPIPILGEIHAGDPIPAQEQIIGWTAIPEQQAKGGTYFALKVKGDCFAGGPRPIYDGDLVVVRQQPEVQDGGIAVVLWPDVAEAQLRRIYRQDGMVVLKSDNPSYPPEIVRKRQLTILGAVVGIQSTPAAAREV